MILKRSKAAPRHKGAASGIAKLASPRKPDNTKPLADVQASFVANRFGLDAARARLTAELAWGGA